MGIGASIFLIALGAILTWAVEWSIGGLDLQVVGAILMVVGVGGLILFFYFWNSQRAPIAVAAVRRRQPTEQPRSYIDPTPPQPVTVTTVTPQQPLPAQVTTVTATAPVTASSQGRPDGGNTN